jgi:putative ABC transport system permease protein
MMGIDCYALCSNISVNNKADVTYEYMYTYKYPTAEVPDGGEATYAEGLKKEANGYNLDVSLLGIDEENPYYDFQVSGGKNKVTISDALASKFKLSIGEKLILTDEVKDMDYSFTVTQIVPYSIGLYAFMDLDDMRELFDQEEDYYNVVFATKELDIDSGRLYAITTKKDISKASDVFVRQMTPLMVTLISASVIIFVIVMYLMLKVMVERSSYPISLMKIYGYRPKEIKKLYLDGNTILIALAAAICIPPAKLIMNALYPNFVANAACGIDLTIDWWLYLLIYAGMMFCYLVIHKILVGKIKKIIPADVLKNRE